MQYDLDMASPHRATFLCAQTLLLSYFGVSEVRKPRITTYACNGSGLCHMRTMPHGIDLGFLKGALLQDAPRRLTGNGKKMRVLSLASFDHDLITYYIDQAVDLSQ